MRAPPTERVPVRTVFIVDDDEAVLQALRFALEIEGFAVETFVSGSELMSVGEFPAGGCLVIDLKLGADDGFAVLAALRGRGVDFPAILITPHPSERTRRRALEAGVAIVEKPILGNALSEAIRKAAVTTVG